MHGLGQYTSATGEAYRGEWVYGKKHGCGKTSAKASARLDRHAHALTAAKIDIPQALNAL